MRLLTYKSKGNEAECCRSFRLRVQQRFIRQIPRTACDLLSKRRLS
nr:MAG TPA: hypothetical protein [Caudoviricetes sp.]